MPDALELGNLEFAQKVIAEWLREKPEDSDAHMDMAELLAKKGDLNGALTAIETAIKYDGKSLVNRNSVYGNILLIRKGTYLLEQKNFGEALNTFKVGFPPKPFDDHLLLRGRAEMGLNQKADAERDLKAASKAFFAEGRIVKRDEAEKLLATVTGKADILLSPVSLPPTQSDLALERKRLPELIRRLREGQRTEKARKVRAH